MTFRPPARPMAWARSATGWSASRCCWTSTRVRSSAGFSKESWIARSSSRSRPSSAGWRAPTARHSPPSLGSCSSSGTFPSTTAAGGRRREANGGPLQVPRARESPAGRPANRLTRRTRTGGGAPPGPAAGGAQGVSGSATPLRRAARRVVDGRRAHQVGVELVHQRVHLPPGARVVVAAERLGDDSVLREGEPDLHVARIVRRPHPAGDRHRLPGTNNLAGTDERPPGVAVKHEAPRKGTAEQLEYDRAPGEVPPVGHHPRAADGQDPTAGTRGEVLSPVGALLVEQLPVRD